jgi:hypothetical protein
MGNQKPRNTPHNIPAIDVEETFRQLARRMEQIGREYGSAEAYRKYCDQSNPPTSPPTE